MTVYPAKGANSGAAILVFPGGGYRGLAIDLEGTEVCDWATTKGITCAVLKYRVPGSGPWWDEACTCEHTDVLPRALEDAQRAMGLLRLHAQDYGIDPHKVGVLGFSAGGHMVADISTHYARRAYAPVDAADAQSARPDFAVALYPGHIWGDEYPGDHVNHDIVDNITADTPPTFLLQNEDDPVDPVANSRTYDAALKARGVPVEYHTYPHGGHAFGLRATKEPSTHWPDLVEAWLKGLGVLPAS
ncbi:MAG: alpha/beta hydrolase [Asticcacaulis sp.]